MSQFKQGLARQFNRGSFTYDSYADMQLLMRGQLLQHLIELPGRFHDILELGCGTGGLTAGLVRAYPDARITAIDLAPAMVARARARLGEVKDLTLAVADAELLECKRASFDLIVSNATVQWFEYPARSLPALAATLRPGGVMLHSSFGPGTFAELHSIVREVETELGHPVPERYGLPLMAGESWEHLLRGAGLCEVQVTATLERHTYPGLIDFLQAVKGIGAAFAPAARGSSMKPGTLREVTRRYNDRFSVDGGVFVSFELLEIAGTM